MSAPNASICARLRGVSPRRAGRGGLPGVESAGSAQTRRARSTSTHHPGGALRPRRVHAARLEGAELPVVERQEKLRPSARRERARDLPPSPVRSLLEHLEALGHETRGVLPACADRVQRASCLASLLRQRLVNALRQGRARERLLEQELAALVEVRAERGAGEARRVQDPDAGTEALRHGSQLATISGISTSVSTRSTRWSCRASTSIASAVLPVAMTS